MRVLTLTLFLLLIPVTEWSIEEKEKLLGALQKHGPTKLELIVKELPLKSITDVKVMITRYQRLANYDPDDKVDSDNPIDSWTEVMRKHTDYNELVPVARALKYIALFERRNESNVKLGELYEMLSDISQGIAPKQLDRQTKAFLFETFTKLAGDVKKSDNEAAEEFLKNIDIDKYRCTKTYTSKSKRETEDSSINPLQVPKELYKKETLKNKPGP